MAQFGDDLEVVGSRDEDRPAGGDSRLWREMPRESPAGGSGKSKQMPEPSMDRIRSVKWAATSRRAAIDSPSRKQSMLRFPEVTGLQKWMHCIRAIR
jgi:hypothetical protein